MFKDTKEALKQLEEQLLEKEDATQVLPSLESDPQDTLRTVIDDSLAGEKPAEHPGRYQNFANNYGGKAPKPLSSPEPLFPEEEETAPQTAVEEAPAKKLTGLWILLIVLLCLDLGIILYWVLRFLGVMG